MNMIAVIINAIVKLLPSSAPWTVRSRYVACAHQPTCAWNECNWHLLYQNTTRHGTVPMSDEKSQPVSGRQPCSIWITRRIYWMYGVYWSPFNLFGWVARITCGCSRAASTRVHIPHPAVQNLIRWINSMCSKDPLRCIFRARRSTEYTN